MAGPAFQKFGNRFGESASFGTCDFGTAAFGGEEFFPYELPILAPGSDRLDASEHVVAAEIVHQRHGVIIGARLHSTRRRWRVVFVAIERADIETLVTFFNLRVFGLLPNGDPDGTTIAVRWMQNEFRAETLRGGYYNLEFDLEELPGYQVAA